MLYDGEFFYREGALTCEGVNLASVAESHGTPAYVYSKRALLNRYRAYEHGLQGIPHRVCFSVKANSNLAVLGVLAREGAAFDIVSGGELFRVLAAGADAGSVVFSGVGKSKAEIQFALEKSIHSFNCESEHEIERISEMAAALGRTASIAIRVNPDVDALTHPYISTGLRQHKFGVDIAEAGEIYKRAAALPGIALEGVSCHIGSQILEMDPLLEAADRALELVGLLRRQGLPIRYIDLGGGLGVRYHQSDRSVAIEGFIRRLREKIERLDLMLLLEPGRSIAAEAGVLLTRVLSVKRNGDKMFVIVDAAMNDLLRPALYHAYHEIIPVVEKDKRERIQADIVGPVCETGDVFARDLEVPLPRPGDLFAFLTAGAYGFVLASNYNSRPRPCEVLIDDETIHIAREREEYDDLIRGERPFVVDTK